MSGFGAWFVNCLSDLMSILVLLEPVIFWFWIRGKLGGYGTFQEVYKLGCLGIATAFLSTCLLTCPLLALLLRLGECDPGVTHLVCTAIGILIAGITVCIMTAKKFSVPFKTSLGIGFKFCIVHLCLLIVLFLNQWISLLTLKVE